MKTLEASFEIVTPMFLGGAEHDAQGIRSASIKGALRFWWRALNWSPCLFRANGNEEEALRLLHQQEAQLFGLAASKDAGGQGVFLLQSSAAGTIRPDAQPFPELSRQPGLRYLLGQGLADRTGLTRNTLPAKSGFTVRLLFRNTINEEQIQSVRNALLMFGLLGGLGSRARHGLGSVAIKDWSIKDGALPRTRSDYAKVIRELLGTSLAGDLPPYSAFSRQTRIDFSSSAADSVSLLDVVGREQQFFRSYGRRNDRTGQHEVNGIRAEPKFEDDHHLMFEVAKNGHRASKAPLRAVFGLPHNYFFSSLPSQNNKAEVNARVGGQETRRASPLLMHVHHLDGEYLAVHTLLQSLFLPQGAAISVGRSAIPTNSPMNWQPIHDYMNRFKQRETIHG